MSIQNLEQEILLALEDAKAKDVINLDVRELTSVTDIMVICSGTSGRHIKTIANYVIDRAKKNGVPPLGVEGEKFNEWVLIDLGDIVVHIMMPEAREFYSLEKLWANTEAARSQDQSE